MIRIYSKYACCIACLLIALTLVAAMPSLGDSPADNAAIKAHLTNAANDIGSGQFAKAIEEEDEAIKIDPRNAGSYCLRGISNDALGSHAQAIADFSKAIAIEARNSVAFEGRGSASEALGNHAKAVTDLTKAIELNPSFAEAYNNRGIS